jgi:hypothetical protein
MKLEADKGNAMQETISADGEVIQTTAIVSMRTPPAQLLAEAAKAAAALQSVIAQKPKPVIMNGESYLEFEDWQTLGNFYGYTAKEDGDPEFVEFGDVRGFKASAVVVDARGREVSRATAFCLSDEEKWGERNKYGFAYILRDGSHSMEDPGAENIVWVDNPDKPGKKRPKKERVLLGLEKVPLYQLASMAQTRACAKALRNVLSWVAVLAGYRGTPAEEMQHNADAPAQQPAKAAPAKANGKQPQQSAAVKDWLRWLVGKPDLVGVNAVLRDDLTKIDKADKGAVWTAIQDYADSQGWKFDKESKQFTIPGHPAEAAPVAAGMEGTGEARDESRDEDIPY